jgi:hypothetical protein
MARSEGRRPFVATSDSLQYFNMLPGCNTYYCVEMLSSFHLLKVNLLLPVLGRGYRMAEIRDE